MTPEGFELPDAAVSETEIVVAGHVVRADSRPIRQAVVTVMDMEGRPIDWSRADNEGNFSLALPRPGRYLVVTSADGWSPRSQVISFDSAQSTHTVELGDRLTISGKVGVGGRTTSGTVVTLTKPTGDLSHPRSPTEPGTTESHFPHPAGTS
ncbi:carboxypeptidase-like regulatory domain-containing protein [Rhodococcus sp. 3Y1]